MVQNPDTQLALDESHLRRELPLTYAYLKQFEKHLHARGSRAVQDVMAKSAFYAMFAVGPYTLAPFKVIWRRMGNHFTACVAGMVNDPSVGTKCVLPIDTVTLVTTSSEDEAHYLCGVLNSSPSIATITSFSAAGRGFGSPSILQQVAIPAYDPASPLHQRLGELSQEAHELAALTPDPSSAKQERGEALTKVEREIDEAAAELWGISAVELKEIQRSLEELG